MSLIAFSIGAMHSILEFMLPREVQYLQQANKRFYVIYCPNSLRWEVVPTLRSWTQLSKLYLEQHFKIGSSDVENIAANVHNICTLTCFKELVAIQALNRVYQVIEGACVLLDSSPLPPTQVNAKRIYAGKDSLYVLHGCGKILIYDQLDGKIRNT